MRLLLDLTNLIVNLIYIYIYIYTEGIFNFGIEKCYSGYNGKKYFCVFMSVLCLSYL
jgi:hypothetical protein